MYFVFFIFFFKRLSVGRDVVVDQLFLLRTNERFSNEFDPISANLWIRLSFMV